ncbi:MAG: nucleotidyltransferase domain-containing protein [Bacilli bacterium]|nr:nucleotidyltransferase domain-containing protein [Bacilli bacterium]
MTLKGVRIQYNLSQIEAANIIGIPVRSLRRYELDENYGSTLKRQMFIELLNKHCEISEEKGLLTIELIKQLLTDLFNTDYKGEIEFCFLFGSYAKGTATETSDVDLYVSSSLSGLRFVGLIERARQVLHKKVDLIRSSELNNNIDLINVIMKEGIKIYG